MVNLHKKTVRMLSLLVQRAGSQPWFKSMEALSKLGPNITAAPGPCLVQMHPTDFFLATVCTVFSRSQTFSKGLFVPFLQLPQDFIFHRGGESECKFYEVLATY